jgi:lysophospholipase L1-like esterase
MTDDLACTAGTVNHSKIVVAAVGDSITVGATCNTWKGGYVKILQDVLGNEKYDVRDCGLCGHDAVRKGHGNAKHATYWGTPALNNSKSMKPDVVIFMLGTNDADEWYNTSKYFNQVSIFRFFSAYTTTMVAPCRITPTWLTNMQPWITSPK